MFWNRELMYRILLPLLGLALIIAASIYSFPRLSAESGEKCVTCHVNPNGGGMRTEFGNHAVAFNELTLPQTKKLFAKKYKPTRVSENARVGFDSRHLVFDNGRVFRMQTDLFLELTPFQNFSYVLRMGETGITENYAVYFLDQQKYYLKAGRFAPAFGVHNEDHTSFNRSRTGNSPLLYLDGLSLGADVAGVSIVGEAFSPNHQGVYTLHAYRPGAVGPFGYLAGASLRLSERVAGSTGSFPHAKALFGGLNYDRFTLLGEWDIVGRSNDTLISYGQLTTRIQYGLYLVGEYNFFDGNRRIADGTEEFLRFSLELYPIPFVLVRPSYTVYTSGPLKDEKDFFLQLHVGY